MLSQTGLEKQIQDECSTSSWQETHAIILIRDNHVSSYQTIRSTITTGDIALIESRHLLPSESQRSAAQPEVVPVATRSSLGKNQNPKTPVKPERRQSKRNHAGTRRPTTTKKLLPNTYSSLT